LRLLYFT